MIHCGNVVWNNLIRLIGNAATVRSILACKACLLPNRCSLRVRKCLENISTKFQKNNIFLQWLWIPKSPMSITSMCSVANNFINYRQRIICHGGKELFAIIFFSFIYLFSIQKHVYPLRHKMHFIKISSYADLFKLTIWHQKTKNSNYQLVLHHKPVSNMDLVIGVHFFFHVVRGGFKPNRRLTAGSGRLSLLRTIETARNRTEPPVKSYLTG